MARRPTPHPTDGELEILQVLWERGPATLGEICGALRDARPVATTTVATMLKVMLDKGLVSRSRAVRSSTWSARVSQNAAATGLVERLLDRVFDGSAQQLVAHLLESKRLSQRDRAELQQLLESASTKKSPQQSRKSEGSR
jgi:predicted transcriptional regulator